MYQDNEEHLRQIFGPCRTTEEIYEALLALGKTQKSLDPSLKTDDNLVRGCQSRLFLHTYQKDDRFFFETESDALISAGIAKALALLYSDLTAAEILSHKPTILQELGLVQNLSPSRSNGLAALEVKIKQDVLKFLTARNPK